MLHVETGLSRADFDELDTDGIALLQHEIRRRHERNMRRDANGYALLCNLLSGKDAKVMTADDFLPKDGAEAEMEGEDLEAARAKYEEWKAGEVTVP